MENQMEAGICCLGGTTHDSNIHYMFHFLILHYLGNVAIDDFLIL